MTDYFIDYAHRALTEAAETKLSEPPVQMPTDEVWIEPRRGETPLLGMEVKEED